MRRDGRGLLDRLACFKSPEVPFLLFPLFAQIPKEREIGSQRLRLSKFIDRVAVLVLGILVFRIGETFDSMDVSKLRKLRE